MGEVRGREGRGGGGARRMKRGASIEENIRCDYWCQHFRPTRSITECIQNGIGAQTDQSERHLHTAKKSSDLLFSASDLALICNTDPVTLITDLTTLIKIRNMMIKTD